ncbi:spastin [Eurytemora carolleeae]|uniref:spastin n=1 Tax=Eurytemora carolleeae TaxID=1294199 RepID=UPI000C78FCF4|nr:spastin [Eurytemora carolleeae]|eukprot:XP_023326776.1 spastin-like [Eurytemora affinis]
MGNSLSRTGVPFCVDSSSSLFSSISYTSIEEMARNLGPNPTHPNVAKQKELHKDSFLFISQALKIDETETTLENKSAAIPLYEKGIEALKLGVNLYIPTNFHDESLVRAQKLKEKMRENLATAEERLNYLNTSLHLHSLSIRANEDEERRNRTHPAAVPKPTRSTPVVSKPTSLITPRIKSSSTAGSRVPRNNRATELRMKSISANGSNAVNKPRRTKSNDDGRSWKDELKSKCTGLKSLDQKLVEMILDEVVPKSSTGVKFADVSGQEKAKSALHEMVVLPSLRPELFTGLRSPARGLLLFGPPGNGKTLLARALATEAQCNLVNISSSSLTSKWVGEGEKLVRTLFSVARAIQPVIIFIDEIDSLLSERRTGEHEAMRRIKTEFLLQFEGMLTGCEEKIVVVAATNRPQELDDAALRRFTKRVYVQMPDKNARIALVSSLISKHGSPLSRKDLDKVALLTDGYTCSDITNLARDAAMAPLREISTAELVKIKPEEMRSINIKDFEKSCERVRKSLSPECLASFEKWNLGFGDIS